MKFKVQNNNQGVRRNEVNIAISYLESLAISLERKKALPDTKSQKGLLAWMTRFIFKYLHFAKRLFNLLNRFVVQPVTFTDKLSETQLQEVSERVKQILLPSLPSLQGGSPRQQELARRALAAIKRYNSALDRHQISSGSILELKIDVTKRSEDINRTRLIDLFRTKGITLLKELMGLSQAIQAVNKAPLHIRELFHEEEPMVIIEQTITLHDGENVIIRATYKSLDGGAVKIPCQYELLRQQG